VFPLTESRLKSWLKPGMEFLTHHRGHDEVGTVVGEHTHPEPAVVVSFPTLTQPAVIPHDEVLDHVGPEADCRLCQRTWWETEGGVAV
jgi:hypothetical protein